MSYKTCNRGVGAVVKRGMMNKTLFCCALIAALPALGGCQPSSGGSGNGNANSGDNTNFNNSVDVNLGGSSEFDLSGQTPADNQITVSLADELGVNRLTSLAFAVSVEEVTISPADTGDLTSNGHTTLNLFVALADTSDACSSGIDVGSFDIGFDAGGVDSITPTRLDAGAEALAAAADGVFELCLRAASDVDQTLIVNRLQVLFDFAMPSLTCAEILALNEVQAAIDVLGDNNLTFGLQTGDQPRNIEGTWSVDQTIEFDPDGTDAGTMPERMDTFSSQSGDGITRTTGEAMLEQSISGSDEGVNLCVLARSNNPTCDQTIARLESYTVAGNGQTLDGSFLAVVVERHTTDSPSCGQQGDFVYGSIDLTRQSTTFLVTRLGKVALPDEFDPHLLVLPDDGSSGTVTDYGSDAALQFPQDGTSVTSPLAIPGQLDAAGYNGIALARDNSMVALVSENPDEFLVFDNASGSLLLEATANGALLGGDVFDFSPDGELAYVISPDLGDLDNLSIFRTSISVAGALAAQYPTPEARTPELSRLNPAGDQLAVLLDGDAGAGLSQWLTFLDLDTGQYTTPLDLRQASGGFVSDRHLVYTHDGARVFMAGDTGVVAVEATDSFAVTTIDASGGEADVVIAIDMSNDGEVVVAAVDRLNGDANFAIVDAGTLEVLNRQLLERIYERGAIDVVHFDTGRACLVINERLRVVPVQTVEPYAVGEELGAADDESVPLLGRAAAGGNVIAVANTTEPAIYLYELAP